MKLKVKFDDFVKEYSVREGILLEDFLRDNDLEVSFDDYFALLNGVKIRAEDELKPGFLVFLPVILGG